MDEWLQNLVRLWTHFHDRDDPARDFAEFYTDPVSVNGVAFTDRATGGPGPRAECRSQ